jgi:hypothetical protein
LFPSRGAQVILLLCVVSGTAKAETCVAPPRPFVPADPRALRDYSDIIRNDFEFYIRDIQTYFRCLEVERVRAFEEAREVSQEYGRFLEALGE